MIKCSLWFVVSWCLVVNKFNCIRFAFVSLLVWKVNNDKQRKNRYKLVLCFVVELKLLLVYCFSSVVVDHMLWFYASLSLVVNHMLIQRALLLLILRNSRHANKRVFAKIDRTKVNILFYYPWFQRKCSTFALFSPPGFCAPIFFSRFSFASHAKD